MLLRLFYAFPFRAYVYEAGLLLWLVAYCS